MQKEEKGRELLLRIDTLLSDLTQIRREVSNWLEDIETSVSADLAPALQTDSAAEVAPQPQAPIDTRPEPKSTVSPVITDIRKTELNIDDDDIIFVPKHKVSLEETFEPRLYFHPRRAFSLADTFLYANELCWGNRAEFDIILDEIEKLSSLSQLQEYLFTVLKLDRESESVKKFVEDVQSTASLSQ